MGNYVPPADKSNGQTVIDTEWNALKNGLASYLNNPNIGGAQISDNPAEKIPESKLDLVGGVSPAAHHARHEPGGADEVVDIDIANSGTPVSAHASRHATGGADPLPTASLHGDVLMPGTLPQSVTAWRKRQESFIQNALGLTADPKNPKVYTLTASTANLKGRGVVRGGFVYFAGAGFSPDAIFRVNIDTGAASEASYPVATGEDVTGLVLIGSNIYCLTSGATGGGASKCRFRKIDNAEPPVVTSLVDLNTGGAPTTLLAMSRLRTNHDGSKLFCLGSDAVNNYIVFANTADGLGLTKTVLTGLNLAHYGLAYGKRGSEEKLWTLYASVTNHTLYRRNIDGTADTSLVLSGTGHRRIAYDGEHIIIVQTGASANTIIVDPWSTPMKVVMEIPVPATTGAIVLDDMSADVAADADLFDGRGAHFGGRQAGGPVAMMLSLYPAEGYRAMARNVDSVGGTGPSAIAADDTYIYLVYGVGGGSQTIRRMLRD